MTTLKLGDRVRHSDGTLGHIVKIREPLTTGVVLVDWKSLGKYITSNAEVLTVENNTTYRWRK